MLLLEPDLEQSFVQKPVSFKKNPREFDIVITDQTMPGLTGKNLAREIKAVRNDIPVILCTGYSEQVNENNISELGIDALAMKPILIKEIAVVIRDLLDKEQRHISP